MCDLSLIVYILISIMTLNIYKYDAIIWNSVKTFFFYLKLILFLNQVFLI